jgi:hypothetical protein
MRRAATERAGGARPFRAGSSSHARNTIVLAGHRRRRFDPSVHDHETSAMISSSHLPKAAAAIAVLLATAVPASAATAIQVGASGKTYASAAVQCANDPATGSPAPMVEAGLYNPKRGASATVWLDGAAVAGVSADSPSSTVRLGEGDHTVVVALSRKIADSYRFAVAAGQCALPDTSGNWFSADGTLEYGASGKSYATVTPGCALNAATGLAQPYVHLFDNGGFLLNVSVNGTPLTQLSATRPHTPVFLGAGLNVISAANGSLSVDNYVRDGGSGVCTLP